MSQAQSLRHGGNIAQEAKRLGIHENELLDASASIVPFNNSLAIQESITKAIHDIAIRCYPDRNYSDLRESIGHWHDVNPSMVLPGNGAAELITWAARDAAMCGISTLPSPGFADYKRALKCWNSSYLELPLPLSWEAKFPQLFPLQSKSEAIWITNPHNPTGQLWSRESLETLLETYKLVICDEAFLPLVPNGEMQSLIPLIKDNTNLIVIRSLTKVFGIAGLRLGYAIADSKRLSQWQSFRDPWPINGIANAFGSIVMNNHILIKKHFQDIENWIRTEGNWLHSHLKALKGIIAHHSATNFQLIQSDKPLITLHQKMAQQGILLRDCRSFKGLGENWLRISLQTKPNNQRIIREMERILK